MKFKIKSLDSREEDFAQVKKELEIIEDFYRAKYNNNEIEDLSVYDVGNNQIRVIKYRKGLIDHKVAIHYEVTSANYRTINKIAGSTREFLPFDKDELKFFDLLDYDLNSLFKHETGQDITDWVSM
jgi:hypothetical protein